MPIYWFTSKRNLKIHVNPQAWNNHIFESWSVYRWRQSYIILLWILENDTPRACKIRLRYITSLNLTISKILFAFFCMRKENRNRKPAPSSIHFFIISFFIRLTRKLPSKTSFNLKFELILKHSFAEWVSFWYKLFTKNKLFRIAYF
jgi:hypothetical protein